MLKAQGIYKSYGDLQVLKDVSLELSKGKVVSITGASGAGKSTLLHILGTLERPDSGTLFLGGTEVSSLSKKQLSRFRNSEIGFVFQFHHLLPEFTALENICIPAFIAGTPKKQAEVRAKELLSMLNLSQRAEHKPSALSGGEAQRVAVARALVNNPTLVLADEPSGNLDSQNADSLHNLFLDLRDQLRQSFVIVTHNKALAAMSDEQHHMKDGLMFESQTIK